MMRTCVLRLNQKYTLDLISAVIKFVTETINGQNIALAKQFVNAGIIDYCMKILKAGFSNGEADFLENVSGNKSLNLWKFDLDDQSKHKMQLTKQEILCLLNCLLNYSTEKKLSNSQNKDFINSLMALNYIQFKIQKGPTYTPDLFNPESKLSKELNIHVGFQSYYLVARLWANNGQASSNIVQTTNAQGFFQRCGRLVREL